MNRVNVNVTEAIRVVRETLYSEDADEAFAGQASQTYKVTVLVRKDANDDTPATQELSIRADTPEQAKTQAIDTIALMSMEVVDITDVELMPHSDPTDADISEPAAKPAGTEVIPTIDVV